MTVAGMAVDVARVAGAGGMVPGMEAEVGPV